MKLDNILNILKKLWEKYVWKPEYGPESKNISDHGRNMQICSEYRWPNQKYGSNVSELQTAQILNEANRKRLKINFNSKAIENNHKLISRWYRTGLLPNASLFDMGVRARELDKYHSDILKERDNELLPKYAMGWMDNNPVPQIEIDDCFSPPLGKYERL